MGQLKNSRTLYYPSCRNYFGLCFLYDQKLKWQLMFLRDQRQYLNNLPRVQLEHCKKLDLLNFYYFLGFQPVQVKKPQPTKLKTNQTKQKTPTIKQTTHSNPTPQKSRLKSSVVRKYFWTFCTGCIENICICQKLSGVQSSQFPFALEFRANKMLMLNGFFCLL